MDFTDLVRHARDPIWDEEVAKLVYAYPVPASAAKRGEKFKKGIRPEELYQIGLFWAVRSTQSHIGPFRWAIDFLVPDGTAVCAAQDGTVIEIQEKFEEWGDKETFSNRLNYLTVQHAMGEFSQYCHLAKRSVHDFGIFVGQSIKKGQVLAKVGKTGWTDRDHLHFIVFRADKTPDNPFGFKSLKVRFT